MKTEHGIIYPRSQALIDFSYRYAKEAHGDQKRKYTCEPYINHPVAVAKLVHAHGGDCEMITAALLHDVIEDTPVTSADLMRDGFGFGVAHLVLELTDVSKPQDGNRKTRKALDRQHTAAASHRAKTIKLADLIDNSCSIVTRDPDFARIYMREKALLLDVLTDGNKELLQIARDIVNAYIESK